MTPKQQAFVEYYAQCGNATEAARKAGYSAGRARVIGGENLTKPAIQAAIAALTEKVASERIADAKERQEFWTALMRGRDIYLQDSADSPPPEIDMKDRLKASELLGKAQLDFIEKVEMTHKTPPDILVKAVHVHVQH